MKTVFIIINSLVVVEFFYIMYLEMFALKSNRSKEIFQISNQDIVNDKIVILFQNQGIYNGVIALILLYALISQDLVLIRLLDVLIIVIASFGAYTSNKKILIKQAGLSILALLISLFI